MAAVVSAAVFAGCQHESMPVQQLGSTEGLQHDDVIPGQFIITLNPTTDRMKAALDFPSEMSYEQRDARVAEIATEILMENGVAEPIIKYAYGTVLLGFTTVLTDAERERVSADPNIKLVEEDRFVSLGRGDKGKPGSGDGGTVTRPTQVTPYGISDVGGATDMSSSSKKAWIMDTGIDADHPDLNINTSLSHTVFTSGKDSKNWDDGNGHGTHVAGTVGAKDDGYDVVGVAAGIELVAVKVLSAQGSGSYSGIISGINYVAANANSGDVANMSLGGSYNSALNQAVIDAASGKNGNPVLFALAAGNESTSATSKSPASANHANIYTVSAHDNNDRFASFSNYGNPPVDFCAPGVSINSTWKGGGLRTISGTSMASPHVCGILAVKGTVYSRGTVSNDPDGDADDLATTVAP